MKRLFSWLRGRLMPAQAPTPALSDALSIDAAGCLRHCHYPLGRAHAPLVGRVDLAHPFTADGRRWLIAQ